VIDSGKIGTVLSGTCFLLSHGMEHWHPDPEFYFKPGGGPILDMGPYYLAALINLLGPVARVQALSSTGFAQRTVTAAGPRKGQSITVETPTTVMALVRFASGADIVFTMSWDVWKHGHPPIELYGTEGSLRVPDPNFFGGAVEVTARGGDWVSHDTSEKPFGRPNWRSPAWPASAPDRANYRCLGVAELASAAARGTPHRASGALASHALDVMHAMLQAGEQGGAVAVRSSLERPAAFTDDDAAGLAQV
jgi:predicted dehydrogenase